MASVTIPRISLNDDTTVPSSAMERARDHAPGRSVPGSCPNVSCRAVPLSHPRRDPPRGHVPIPDRSASGAQLPLGGGRARARCSVPSSP